MEEIHSTDLELLRRFARAGDEQAFETLVARYANLVFGVAMRRGMDRPGAEDVTQKVFAVLARKAGKLSRKGSLAGWLSRTATLEARYQRRSEINRLRKMDKYQESGAADDAQNTDADIDAGWKAALPHLDEAMADLGAADQEVILQRFYNEQSFATIATSMGKTEAAVQKQSRRALEKLSKVMQRRGIVVPVTVIASGLGAELAKAAPVSAISTLSQGAIASAPALTGGAILTNTLHTMAYAKTKTALIVAAAAAIPTGFQWNKINQLEDQLEARPAAVESDVSPRVASLEAELAELKGQLAAAKSPSVSTPALTALDARDDAPGAAKTNPLAKMFEEPGMRDLIRKQMKGGIAATYGAFSDLVGLSGEKREAFEELLVNRQMNMSKDAMKMMSGDISDEEKAEINAAVELAMSASQDELREFLGDEAFEQFEAFEDSTTERMELDGFKSALASAGVPELSLEKEQALMGIMHEERKAFKFSGDFSADQNELTDWRPTVRSVEAVTADYIKLHDQVAARAGTVLNDQEMKAFLTNQASYRKMMEAGMEMGARMFDSVVPAE